MYDCDLRSSLLGMLSSALYYQQRITSRDESGAGCGRLPRRRESPRR
jgi:hypothetical protein